MELGVRRSQAEKGETYVRTMLFVLEAGGSGGVGEEEERGGRVGELAGFER